MHPITTIFVAKEAANLQVCIVLVAAPASLQQLQLVPGAAGGRRRRSRPAPRLAETEH